MALVLYDPDSISAVLHQTTRKIRIDGTIKREFEFQQSGTGTGSLVWPASELLSRYLSQEVPTQLDQWLCNGMDLGDSLPLYEGVAFEKCEFGDIASWRKGFWSNQSVLELGAGLGVLANTFLHIGVSDIIATDGEESVVDQMSANLISNSIDMKELETYSSNSSLSDKCQVLKWGDENDLRALSPFEKSSESCDDKLGGAGVDIIVATDVVFGDKRDVWRALAATLADACRQRKNYIRDLQSHSVQPEARGNEVPTRKSLPSSTVHCQDTLVLIAQTRRYPDLENEFYNILEEEMGFKALFDIDISGVVKSMYGTTDKEREVTNAPDDSMTSSSEVTSSRSCTSETILHAYYMK